jgi:L-alanine-DL-glutamate epimerase-like enolase superfamily enzyme
MKITQVSVFKENLDLLTPYSIAYETIEFAENILLVIFLENNTYGIGTASPASFVTGETTEDCLKILKNQVEPLLLGEDTRNFKFILRTAHSLLQKFPAALAAVDIALHDLFSKTINWPLYKFLGNITPTQIPTSVTIGITNTQESIDLAKYWVKKGFRILKVKTGISLEEDFEKLKKIREEVGREILIRIDGNEGYSLSDIPTISQIIDELPLELLEQPFARNSSHHNRLFSKDIISIIAADEELHNVDDALKLISSPYLDFGIFNIKLMKCGGIDQASKIGHLALAKNLKLMWGCNDESRISIMAALHVAHAFKNTRYLDLDGHLDLGLDFVEEEIAIKDGCLTMNNNPGLGFKLLKKYT